jgi:two-component system, OmpR family, KDP operon response regulator KdpE
MTDAPRTGRVLVVEDEAPIRRYLGIALAAEGHEVIEADRGRAGIDKAATALPDCVILDLGLPDMDGKAVIAAIREWSRVPILVLSVRDGEAEKIAALDAGADDYVTKPFGTGELTARLRALLRKGAERGREPGSATIGPLTVNFAARTVAMARTEVSLTRKEFDVLAFLARNPGRLVSHKQLLTAIWGPAHATDTHYLRIAVGHIRDKLGDDAAQPKLIFTEPGVGYRMAST